MVSEVDEVLLLVVQHKVHQVVVEHYQQMQHQIQQVLVEHGIIVLLLEIVLLVVIVGLVGILEVVVVFH